MTLVIAGEMDLMRKDDYTRLPLGTKIDDGEITKCPYCGRNGLADTANGKTFYTHFQEVGFNEMGNPVINWEWCPQGGNLMPDHVPTV